MAEKIEIITLIPYGKQNAISRQSLTALCLGYSMIPDDVTDPDRYMRKLVNEARRTHAIVSTQDGQGYFQPLTSDESELAAYVNRETGRAIKIFQSIKYASALLDDMRHERLTPEDIDTVVS